MNGSEFPESEFEARCERAQTAMHEANLDALFFTSEAEMRYFTGFRTAFWLSPTRPWFLVLPANGKPIAIIPEIGADLMTKTWLDDIRTWRSPHEKDDGISLLASVLEDYSNIGILKGRESALRMPLANYEALLDLLPRVTFHNATPLVQSLRAVKSSAEIEKTSKICQIASTSFAKADQLFHVGQPLEDAFKNFKIELLKNGAEEVPYLVGGVGQGGYRDVISPPDKTPIQSGDILMLDTGATLEGYYCDFDRNFAFESASDEAMKSYDILYQATDAAIRAARPGILASELCTIMQDVISQSGGDVGRMGHGLGMQLTEPPSLVSFDHTPMQAGMVMTIEPSMSMSDGRMMVHEENIVITEGKARMLSNRAPSELPIL
ncbi:MAG: aminopeptidase P family protein [Rhizobiaceae bacterium]|nr:aminopeptidase P family protein [Rhizobiaceae bacterium]